MPEREYNSCLIDKDDTDKEDCLPVRISALIEDEYSLLLKFVLSSLQSVSVVLQAEMLLLEEILFNKYGAIFISMGNEK